MSKVKTAKYGYTLEVYRIDKRTKAGEKLVKKIDYDGYSGNAMMDEIKYLHNNEFPRNKYRLDFFETYVTRKNAMTGKEYQERYDTSYFSSPSSETYWSM